MERAHLIQGVDETQQACRLEDCDQSSHLRRQHAGGLAAATDTLLACEVVITAGCTTQSVSYNAR